MTRVNRYVRFIPKTDIDRWLQNARLIQITDMLAGAAPFNVEHRLGFMLTTAPVRAQLARLRLDNKFHILDSWARVLSPVRRLLRSNNLRSVA